MVKDSSETEGTEGKAKTDGSTDAFVIHGKVVPGRPFTSRFREILEQNMDADTKEAVRNIDKYITEHEQRREEGKTGDGEKSTIQGTKQPEADGPVNTFVFHDTVVPGRRFSQKWRETQAKIQETPADDRAEVVRNIEKHISDDTSESK